MISGVTAERSLAVSLAPNRSAAVATVKRSATVVASLALTTFADGGSASAHVTVTADHTWRAGVAIVTFMVPNESETGSPTTQFRVALPNVTSTHRVDAGLDSTTRPRHTQRYLPVGYLTATPDAGIPADEFALFRIQVNLPDSDTASFPATQIYADGKTVHWDQPPLPDGSEPEHPAPTLKLTAATAEKPPPAPDSGSGDAMAGQPWRSLWECSPTGGALAPVMRPLRMPRHRRAVVDSGPALISPSVETKPAK